MIATRTIVVSLLLGTGITLLASIIPARRATRVPPIAAVREGAVLPQSRLAGALARTPASASRSPRSPRSRSASSPAASAAQRSRLLLGGGVLGLFAGIALLAPRLVKPLARVVGLPGRRAGGVAGELASANAVRNPGRTASTAAALMIGLTLVTVVAVLGSGLRVSTQNAVKDQVSADYVVDGKQELPFRAAEGDELEGIAGVKAATHVRSDRAIVQGKENQVSGIDPATIARFYHFELVDGLLRSHARPARQRRRARDEGLRRERAPEGRRAR